MLMKLDVLEKLTLPLLLHLSLELLMIWLLFDSHKVVHVLSITLNKF